MDALLSVFDAPLAHAAAHIHAHGSPIPNGIHGIIPVLVCAFIGVWGFTIVFLLVNAYRVPKILGGHPAGGFPASAPTGPGWYKRFTRAHMNCVEYMALFAPIAFASALLGATNEFTSKLYLLIAAARIMQTLTHCCSGADMFVMIRANFFFAQMIPTTYLAYNLFNTVYSA